MLCGLVYVVWTGVCVCMCVRLSVGVVTVDVGVWVGWVCSCGVRGSCKQLFIR